MGFIPMQRDLANIILKSWKSKMSEKRLAPRLLCFFHRHDQKDFRKKLMYNSNEVYKRSRVFCERLVLGIFLLACMHGF